MGCSPATNHVELAVSLEGIVQPHDEGVLNLVQNITLALGVRDLALALDVRFVQHLH